MRITIEFDYVNEEDDGEVLNILRDLRDSLTGIELDFLYVGDITGEITNDL